MGLARDLSDLTRARGGLRPDRPAQITPALIRHWAALDDRERDFAHPDALIRHSWAGRCSRALQYYVSNAEVTEALTEPDYYRFAIGKMSHDFWQALVVETLGDQGWTDLEPECEMVLTNDDGSVLSAGHGDLYGVSPTGVPTMFEVKTINGFGFKSIIGQTNQPPGPRSSDLLQGCMNALAKDCQELRMVYLALELVSPAVARKAGLDDLGRFCAEWTLTRDQWFPLASGERGRWERVVEHVASGVPIERHIPDPEIPDTATIVNPSSGQWNVTDDQGYVTDSGRTWHCDYCSFRTQCQTDS